MAQVLLSEMQDTQPGNGHIIKEKLILWQNPILFRNDQEFIEGILARP